MKTTKIISIAVATILLFSALFVGSRASAACAALDTSRGVVTTTITIPTTTTYRVWSRIMAPDTTNNSYSLEIDPAGTSPTCNVDVGDNASMPASTWTWVNYKNGSTSTFIDVSLTAGSHTVTLTGREDNVSVDRLIFTSDLTCTPTGTGDNCVNLSGDTTAPTVSMTAPTAGATVTNSTAVSATASDNVGVVGVQFQVDGNNLQAEDTTSPYSVTWDSTTIANGSHTLTAIARDAAGNTTTTTPGVTVTVSNTLKAGDVNSDGKIDIFDLSLLAANYSQSGKVRAQGDLNGDGTVNIFDLSILATNWGK